jgi:hypothetical protein
MTKCQSLSFKIHGKGKLLVSLAVPSVIRMLDAAGVKRIRRVSDVITHRPVLFCGPITGVKRQFLPP